MNFERFSYAQRRTGQANGERSANVVGISMKVGNERDESLSSVRFLGSTEADALAFIPAPAHIENTRFSLRDR